MYTNNTKHLLFDMEMYLHGKEYDFENHIKQILDRTLFIKDIDYNEIEDAHWFSIEELRSLNHPLISGGFKLPRVDSIARRLVDNWINKFN